MPYKDRERQRRYQKVKKREYREERQKLRNSILSNKSLLDQLKQDFPIVHRYVVGKREEKRGRKT